MKIDDMAAFMAVIRCQSTNLAADALRVTQSAITRRVQNFEQDLGATLLDRNTKPLKPTSIGLRVYRQCTNINREIEALRDLIATEGTPSGILRLGVPQTLSDVVLLDALQQIHRTYPQLHTQVINGWGSSLINKMENGELEAAAALFPVGKVFPKGIFGQSAGRMPLVVVAARGDTAHKKIRLRDCCDRGWVLNPDGCGFRAGLQNTLHEQGLDLQVNLETFGTELQLGLVAGGQGLGLVPEPLLMASQHRDQLEVLQLSDFKPMVDLLLFHPQHLGNLQKPVELFGRIAKLRIQSPHIESIA